MAFSDARNERDRAETGRNSANHGGGNARDAADRNRAAMFGGGFGSGRGTLSQQQDQRNLEAARKAGNVAPGVRDPRASPYDSRTVNPRYNQNLIASGPLTPHNMWEAFRSAVPLSGIGAMGILGGALGIQGLGPQYEGVSPRSATGFSYDGPNRFGVNGSAMFPNQQPGIQPVQAAGAAPPPPAPMQQGMVPAATLGGPVTGLGSYSVNRPSYGFFGSPGGAPLGQSAILNPMQGMRPGPKVMPFR